MNKELKHKKISCGNDREELEKLRVRLFILKLLLLMALFVSIKNFKPVNDVINVYGQYNKFIAFFTSQFLSLLSIPSSSNGQLIYLPSITLDVGFECSGIEAVLMFSVAVIAYPGKWKNKLIGITAGFLVLQVLNLGRVLSLAYSAVHFRSFFEIIHLYIAQGFMIAAALLIFIVYLNFSGGNNKVVN